MRCIAGSTRQARAGFTLVEVIAAMTVLATVAMTCSIILFSAVDSYATSSVSSRLTTELSMALEQLVRQFRKIELDSAAPGIAANIDDVTSTSMTWRDSGGDVYSVSLSGDELRLALDGGTAQLLLDDVSQVSIRTYDQNNTPLPLSLTGSGCDPIRRVEVSVTRSRSGEVETLGAKVFLRSTMQGGGT